MIDTHSAFRGQTRRRTRSRGVALPVVLLIAAMMLATSAAWFDVSVTTTRNATGLYDHLLALHAADAALTSCARSVINGSIAPILSAQSALGEPVGWKSQTTFESNAIAPFASWPALLAIRAPQCLIEAWRLTNRADARAYLVTARGYGRNADAQVWLQMQLVTTGGTFEKHWRRVAARPF
jgi:Tfp pilus assembly protein PilX